MSKEDIVEGLRLALARGEPLQKAMMSFYNSGYLKQDIESAARELQNPPLLSSSYSKPLSPPSSPSSPQPSSQMLKPVSAPPKPFVSTSPAQSQVKPIAEAKLMPIENKSEETFDVPSPQTPFVEDKSETANREINPQKVSSYGAEKPSKLGTALIFALVFFLLVLVGALIGTFLFKEELTVFFSKLFG